jgi:hypothetical protein
VFSFLAFSTRSMATWPVGGLHFAQQVTEQQTFYGWPLVVLLVGSLWVLRTVAVRALAAAAVGLAFLSLGDELYVKGRDTHIPGIWRLVHGLPGFAALPPHTVALALVPIVVIVLGLLVDRGTRLVRTVRPRPSRRYASLIWYGLVAAVLVPLAPATIKAADLPTPAFVTRGSWRGYVSPDGPLVLVPGVNGGMALRWTIASGQRLAVTDGVLDNKVLTRAAGPSSITDADRASARDRLRRARVSVVVLPAAKSWERLREMTTVLLGVPARLVDDVWLWDLRTVS